MVAEHGSLCLASVPFVKNPKFVRLKYSSQVVHAVLKKVRICSFASIRLLSTLRAEMFSYASRASQKILK